MEKLLLLAIAPVLLVGSATLAASENEVEKAPEPKTVICELFPSLCAVTTLGGNGGGVEPPKPTSYGELNK